MSDLRISGPQCRTIREAEKILKAKKSGKIIREAILLERAALLERIRYLEPSRIFTIDIFELLINFAKKASSYMLDWVVHAPLNVISDVINFSLTN